jgi:FAD binding domain/Berberine and berberine like
MITDAHIESLRADLRGELVCPGDAQYGAARRVYNAMIDRYPRAIVRCADIADIISSVRFAAEHDVLLAVRGGGHNGAGFGVCDDGLVIDLAHLKGIRVDPETRTVRVDGGCTWGEVDHATHAFGMATPSGVVSTTGVGGLTLGGGIGHLTRKHGLSIDNLLEADVVLADGRLLTCDAERNADLFWAIRGGGGNFGIVTSFRFRLHPVETVVAGPTLWPIEKAPEAMAWYRDFILAAPEALNGFFVFLIVPPGPPFPEHLHLKNLCGVLWCYAGPAQEAAPIFDKVRSFGPPLLHAVQPMPFPALQSAFDALYPPGMQWYWRANFVNELSDDAIALHAQFGAEIPTLRSTMHLYPISGAARKVGNNQTAFSYRDANWAEVIIGVDPDPAGNDRIIGWTKAYWNALHPHSAGGAYVNFLMDEGRDRIKATYRDNYQRLTVIKHALDPTNLFRVNQNIQSD